MNYNFWLSTLKNIIDVRLKKYVVLLGLFGDLNLLSAKHLVPTGQPR